MIELNEIALITRTVAFNDTRAFGRLVEKYQSAIRRFFIHQTGGNKALSDDLAQETFIRAYQHIGKFQSLSGFSTWLHRIAYNILNDYFRSTHSTGKIKEEFAEQITIKTHFTDSRYDIHIALKQLNKNERVCISLFYMEDMSIERITQITELPIGTVKSHLSRGKQKLATWLKNNGYGKE